MGSRPLRPSLGPCDKPTVSRNWAWCWKWLERRPWKEKKEKAHSLLSLSPKAAAKACRMPTAKEPVPAWLEGGSGPQARKRVLSTPSLGTEGWDAERDAILQATPSPRGQESGQPAC